MSYYNKLAPMKNVETPPRPRLPSIVTITNATPGRMITVPQPLYDPDQDESTVVHCEARGIAPRYKQRVEFDLGSFKPGTGIRLSLLNELHRATTRAAMVHANDIVDVRSEDGKSYQRIYFRVNWPAYVKDPRPFPWEVIVIQYMTRADLAERIATLIEDYVKSTSARALVPEYQHLALGAGKLTMNDLWLRGIYQVKRQFFQAEIRALAARVH